MVLPYISCIGMCRPIGFFGVFAPFGMKTPVHFAYFSLGSGMVLEGTTGVYERELSFNSKSVRKKEKYGNSKLRI